MQFCRCATCTLTLWLLPNLLCQTGGGGGGLSAPSPQLPASQVLLSVNIRVYRRAGHVPVLFNAVSNAWIIGV